MKKVYSDNNETIFHDPDDEMLILFKQIDKDYHMESIPPAYGFVPKYQRLKNRKIELDNSLFETPVDKLIKALSDNENKKATGFSYSALDVLSAIALKIYSECELCGISCKADRYNSVGQCGLNNKEKISNPFIHVAEEGIINPAVNTSFLGCSMQCVYCIDSDSKDKCIFNEVAPKAFWEKVEFLSNKSVPINTLEFVNPTESISAVFSILSKSPDKYNYPVVMNTHLHGSKLFYETADMITDVWLVDLRYGNCTCAENLSKVHNYTEHAVAGLEALYSKGSRTIVRILIVPGHFECCHIPVIKLLSKYKDKFAVSVLEQYVPENQAADYPDINRRPTKTEIMNVKKAVKDYGLINVNDLNSDFWE